MPPMISLERQILHAGRMYQILACGNKPPLKWAWLESRDHFFQILPQSYLCNW